MSNFPERLRSARKLNNATQKQVAGALSIPEQAYQKYEYGRVEPKYTVIIKLCSYFNVSVDYLLGLSDNPKKW